MFHKNSSPLSEVEMKRRRCLCVFACFSFFFFLEFSLYRLLFFLL